MKASDYLAAFLVKNGIHHVFQVIGGASVHMVNSLDDQKGMNYICVNHEQAATMAAEAYARMTKNMGAAMATSGPGMTNLITGIGCAYFDSIPIICITGQVNTFESKGKSRARQIGFQETDIVKMVKPITKFSVQVTDPDDLKYLLEKAVAIAKSGRPGPVLIDIPMDIQRAEIDPKKLKSFNGSELKEDLDDIKTIEDKILQTIELIQKAKRPVVIAGGAIRYADQVDKFENLIDILGFPVVATWSGIDVLPHDHPLYRGQIGVYGARGANFTIQNSDCIISIGSRLDTRITGGKPETFARAAKKIVVDIDRAELYKNRGLTPDVGLCSNVAQVIPLLIKSAEKIKIPDVTSWKKKTLEWKNKYPQVLSSWRRRKSKVDPYVFMEALSNSLSGKDIVVTDCGANLTWTIQGFNVKRGLRLFSAMGNSPMAYAFPASIGASIALNKKPVVCIIGDGGFQMNIQELQTMIYHKLPIKIFIINNHSYGIIKQFQEMYFHGKYVATTPESGYSVPDFIKIAKAYGVATETIRNHKELYPKIKKVLACKGSILCDVIIPDDSKLIPKLEFGKPIEDLSPLLPRKEFLGNMIVDPDK
ncbi:MAG: hypothetical protein A3H17_01225 [Candidatus Levybacteria bacterium RIFCSPLOWO2_12_FULL_37_14]|nr:MAG: hypothetical protein A3H17_01225 [Candidatus Levybacteria bacterium RIFCSPLOWO2_12_FULL_37_14]